MKLLCFLGNIGDKYENTRHNAGFLCADFFQKERGFSSWKEEKKFFGSIAEGILNGEKVLFLKPHTFMNLSGKSVQACMQFYKIERRDICIIYDDKDLPFGKIRYREKGSSGGQNGIKDIIRVLGSEKFDRIKIGIGNDKQAFFKDTADFVLSKFSSDERVELDQEIFPEVQIMLEEKVFS